MVRLMQGSIRKHRDKWQARFKVKDVQTGQWRQVSKILPTKREAELWLRRETAHYDTEAADAGSMTFAELVDEWYQLKHRRWSPTTRNHHRYALPKVLEILGPMPITKIKSRDIDRWITHQERAGVSVRTIGRRFDIVRQAFKQAVRWEYIVRNPTDNVSMPEQTRTRVTPPTPEEIARLGQAAWDHSDDFGMLVQLAVATGARRGELLALRWSDIDFGRQRLTIERAIAHGDNGDPVVKTTKTGNTRTIVLGDGILGLLRAYKTTCAERALACGQRRSDGLVFTDEPGSDQPWRPDYVTMTWGRLRTRLGLATRFHDLRHYCATRLLTSGVDLATVAHRLGHADGGKTTISIYSHVMQASDNKAASLIDGDIVRRTG